MLQAGIETRPILLQLDILPQSYQKEIYAYVLFSYIYIYT